MSRILNIDIKSITADDLLKQMTEGVLYTPNVDHLVKLQHDAEFYNAYKNADWVICDSKIIYWASKLLNESIIETIPGSSFFSCFYNYHKNNPDCRIFLLGSAPGVASRAMDLINERVGRRIVVDAWYPSFGFENDEIECNEIVNIINMSGATVLVVGVGAPKQEKWIAKYRDRMPNIRIFMALGATIDFEAGIRKRAPRAWRKMCAEWLYRFLQEPKRLFGRYFIEDIKFFGYFMQQLFHSYRNPFKMCEREKCDINGE